jgi:hypothetical protein
MGRLKVTAVKKRLSYSRIRGSDVSVSGLKYKGSLFGVIQIERGD